MIDLGIIGGGPAGLTSAIYALRAGLKVNIFEGNMFGGQVSIVDKIENYPGFQSIDGAELSNIIYEQVVKLGGKFIFSKVNKVDLKSKEKVIYTSDEEFKCKTVIIANGLKRRILSCKGEKEFSGKGVSYCATCDGSFFKSKNVIVVGGGNSALDEALYLSKICKNVLIIVRKSFLRGENFLVDAIKNKSNINIKYETEIDEIKGDKFVKNVVLKKNNSLEELSIDGVFISIGYMPDCEIYKNQIHLDENGYFKADESCITNIDGVYVAGDCRKKPLRQIVTAMSDGAVCASNVSKFIAKNYKN